VIQESHASGVPAVVTNRGGPKFLVEDGVNGFVARNDQHFVACVLRAMEPQTDFAKMKTAARVQGEQASWDRVFEKVYGDYEMCLDMLRGSSTTDGKNAGRGSDDARGRPVG
jgi:glycosyltransferase involved in cell wall biosynthesis